MAQVTDFFKKALQTGVDIAQKAGVRMPLDSEMASLDAKAKQTRSFNYSLQSFYTTISRLDALGKTEPSAQVDAKNFRDAIKDAQEANAVALGRLSDAISQGSVAKSMFKYGTKAANPTALFFTKKAIADAAYNTARLKFDRVRSAIEDRNRRLISQTSLTPGRITQTGGQVFRDLTQWTGRSLQNVGQGAMAVGDYGKYIIPGALILGGVIIFTNILQFIPKPRRD